MSDAESKGQRLGHPPAGEDPLIASARARAQSFLTARYGGVVTDSDVEDLADLLVAWFYKRGLAERTAEEVRRG